MNKAEEFMKYSCNVIDTIMREEKDNIEKAAVALKNTMVNGGLLYTFGTGHSTMLCMEPYFRAGGLVACYPILDERLMCHTRRPPEEQTLERQQGVTAKIFEKYPLKKGDTMLIFCYGGKNATSIEAGLICKELGVTSIGIISLEHSLAVGTTHPSGKLVHEACDIYIDNHGRLGDASIDFDGFTVGPISTIVGAVIVQAVTCRAVELMLAEGHTPEILLSMNMPGGDEHNEPLREKYEKIIHIM
jgi:uncharacterized phosphosugar-binding protein